MGTELQANERRHEKTLARVGSVLSTAEKQNGWHSATSLLYRNWLEYIWTRKMSSTEAKAVVGVPENEAAAMQSMLD